MALGFDQLVSKLQVRFDYQSSRSVTREALSRAGLKEKDQYSDEELQKFVDGLNAVAKNLARVWTALGLAPSGQPLPPPPAPKVEVKPPEPPKPEPKVEVKAPEPVVEAAPEPAPEPVVEAAPEPVFEAAPEPTPEPVVEAAPEAEPAPEADSWFGKKKKKHKNRDDSSAEGSPEGETPADG